MPSERLTWKRRLLRPSTIIGGLFLLVVLLVLLAIPFLKAPGHAQGAKADLELAKASLGAGDLDTVAALGAEIAARYGGDDLTPELAAAMRAQAAKRVGLQFVERRRRSWDHRKLGGTY